MDRERKTRNKQICIRCSEDEKAELLRKSQKARLSLNEYLLSCSSRKKIVVIEGVPALVNEINKIGININQVVRMCNVYEVVTKEDIDKLEKQLINTQNLVGELLKEICKKESK